MSSPDHQPQICNTSTSINPYCLSRKDQELYPYMTTEQLDFVCAQGFTIAANMTVGPEKLALPHDSKISLFVPT